MTESNDIPEPVKRRLRQEAGFGCCFCGGPIIQYHHIVERSVEKHNRPEDMMAVCPNRHDAITKGAVPEADQRAAKARPKNIERGYADGLLAVTQNFCVIELGTNTFASEGIIFSVDGEPLLRIGISEGRLSLDVMLYDSSGNLLAVVVDNEWVSGDPLPWDLKADHQKLLLRTRRGEPRLNVNARLQPMQVKARLMKGTKEIRVQPSGIQTFGGAGGHLRMSDTVCVGVAFNFDTAADTITLQPDGREGSGTLQIEQDRLRRLRLARESLARINAASGQPT